MHLQLLLIGGGLGLVAVVASVALARPADAVDDGWVTAALMVALTAVLAAADQVPGWSVLVVAGCTAASAGGAAIARAPTLRIWPLDVVLGTAIAVITAGAVLPDTEGPALLAAALAPVTLALLRRRLWWRGPAATAATTAVLVTLGIVGIDAAAGRDGALAVTAVAAGVGAVAIVGLGRLLVDRT